MTNRTLKFVEFENGIYRFRNRIIAPKLVGTGVIVDSKDPYEEWCNFEEGYSPDATERYLRYEKRAEELKMKKFNKPELMRIMGELGWDRGDIESELLWMHEIRKEIIGQRPSNANAYSLGEGHSASIDSDYRRAILYLCLI